MKLSVRRPILLVEDNPIDLDLTQRALARHDLTDVLQVARDGEDVLARLKRWELGELVPAVILMDIKLPKVDGLEVLRQIKTHPVCRAIPVVMLTTSTDSRDIQTAYDLGANSYVVKPLDFDQFTEMVGIINHYWSSINKAWP